MALRLQDEPSWTAFLTEARIPATEAAAYAKIFIDNRVNETTVLDLTADHLKTLGINVLGDILAILRQVKTTTTQAITATADSTSSLCTSTYRPPPATVKLPAIVAEMTNPQFRKLRIDWDIYKQVTNLPQPQTGALLYSACDGNVQTSLINSHPTFFEMNEDDMLKSIETIVTKRVNPTIHRMNFGNIAQQENETIQDHTRLLSSAVDCEFSCPECQQDISRVNIKDQLIRGLFNETLQTDVLAKASQLKSVEEVVKHAQAWEGAISGPVAIACIRRSKCSSYIRLPEISKPKQTQ